MDALTLVGGSLSGLTRLTMAQRLFSLALTESVIYKQSELPRPIPRNSVESDHGCTSSIYFDNAGDNVTLTLHNITLTSQKPCLHNNRCDCSKTNGLNEVYVGFFFNIAIFY